MKHLLILSLLVVSCYAQRTLRVGRIDPSGSPTLTVSHVGPAGTPPSSTFSISGSIAGPAISGLTVTCSSCPTTSTTSDASGSFTFSDVPNGAYTLAVVAASGHTVTPANIVVTVSNANNSSAAFTSAAITYTLSGIITSQNLTNNNQGLTVNLSGAATGQTTTAANGWYVFSGLTNGTYTVTPVSVPGAQIAPVSRAGTIANLSQTLPDFTAWPGWTVRTTLTGTIPPAAGNYVFVTGPVNYSSLWSSNPYTSAARYTDGEYGAYIQAQGYRCYPAGGPTTQITIPFTIAGANVDVTPFYCDTTPETAYGFTGSFTGVPAGMRPTIYVTGTLTGTFRSPNNTTLGINVNVFLPGNYVVTPTLPGYTFTSACAGFSNGGCPVTITNATQGIAAFVASPQ